MANFFRTERINLGEFDPSWEKSFILVKVLGSAKVLEFKKMVNELKEEEQTLQFMQDLIGDNFVSGMIYDLDQKTEVALAKEDLQQFDQSIMTRIIEIILAGSKKKITILEAILKKKFIQATSSEIEEVKLLYLISQYQRLTGASLNDIDNTPVDWIQFVVDSVHIENEIQSNKK